MKRNDSQVPLLYCEKAGRELGYFMGIIQEVFLGLEDVGWTTRHGDEQGFYERNKKAGIESFFGMWFEVWEKYGIPFCLTFEVPEKIRTDKYQELRNYIETSKEKGIIFKEYDGYAVILFEYNYFKHVEDADRIISLYIHLWFILSNTGKK